MRSYKHGGISYDYLVVATGAKLNLDEPERMKEVIASINELKQSLFLKLKGRVVYLFSLADSSIHTSVMHFVIFLANMVMNKSPF